MPASSRLVSSAELARELGVTPPSVSKRLAQMEQRLGVQLLNRTTRRLSLTDEGELYHGNATRILAEIAEIFSRGVKIVHCPTAARIW